MNIDITKIVTDKLTQLDNDGIIQRKIEETIEKSVTDAITSELDSYNFKNIIGEQLKQGISEVAGNVGLSAYNGYIAQAVKAIVSDMQSQDIAEKVQATLNDILLQRHENIALSDIFRRYREWVNEHVDEGDKRYRKMFTASIEVSNDAVFTNYVCRFSEHPCADSDPDVELRLYTTRISSAESAAIFMLSIDGHNLGNTLRIGYLSDFEAFLTNLYYSKTKIIIDLENVECDCHFDLHED